MVFITPLCTGCGWMAYELGQPRPLTLYGTAFFYTATVLAFFLWDYFPLRWYSFLLSLIWLLWARRIVGLRYKFVRDALRGGPKKPPRRRVRARVWQFAKGES
jgi:hypothetical protein